MMKTIRKNPRLFTQLALILLLALPAVLTAVCGARGLRFEAEPAYAVICGIALIAGLAFLLAGAVRREPLNDLCSLLIALLMFPAFFWPRDTTALHWLWMGAALMLIGLAVTVICRERHYPARVVLSALTIAAALAVLALSALNVFTFAFRRHRAVWTSPDGRYTAEISTTWTDEGWRVDTQLAIRPTENAYVPMLIGKAWNPPLVEHSENWIDLQKTRAGWTDETHFCLEDQVFEVPGG